MPDEANVCLNCLATYGEDAVVATEKGEKIGMFVKIKSAIKAINKKKAAAICAAAFCAMIIIPVAVLYGTGNLDQYLTPDNSVVSPDAKVENKETKDDGSIVITYDDGTVSTENTDGTIITETTEGTIITQKTDGTVITQKKDGTVVTEKVDGTVITEKTDGTVVTEKPDGTTEVTQAPTTQPTTTTTPPTTENTTKADATTTATTTSTTSNVGDYAVEYDNFEYTVNGSNVAITAYTGNSAVVVVPDIIEDKKVSSIEANTFKDNNTVKKIYFGNSDSKHTIYIKTGAIINCDSLEEVTFNNAQSWDFKTLFIKNCQSMLNININSSLCKFVDGGLYCKSSNNPPGTYLLCYFCEGYQTDTYSTPDFCYGANWSAFKYNKNVKYIYVNNDAHTSPSYFDNLTIEKVFYYDSHPHYFDVDGVIFDKVSPYSDGTRYLRYYSPYKKDKAFSVPENVIFNHTKKNPYLEQLTIPASVEIDSMCLEDYCEKSVFTNLNTIYIQQDSEYVDYIQSNFDGTVIVY